MSSHHIVREKQEPALLVVGLDQFDAEHLGQLLEWSPTVLATADTVDQLLMDDIHVDYLLTDESTPYTHQQNGLQLLHASPSAWINAGLAFLLSKGYPAVNIVTDQEEFTPYLPFISNINMVIYLHQQKIYAIKSGFEKWKPAGTQLRILTAVGNLETMNLMPLATGTWQVTADGFIQLRFSAPYLIISEEI